MVDSEERKEEKKKRSEVDVPPIAAVGKFSSHALFIHQIVSERSSPHIAGNGFAVKSSRFCFAATCTFLMETWKVMKRIPIKGDTSPSAWQRQHLIPNSPLFSHLRLAPHCPRIFSSNFQSRFEFFNATYAAQKFAKFFIRIFHDSKIDASFICISTILDILGVLVVFLDVCQLSVNSW